MIALLTLLASACSSSTVDVATDAATADVGVADGSGDSDVSAVDSDETDVGEVDEESSTAEPAAEEPGESQTETVETEDEEAEPESEVELVEEATAALDRVSLAADLQEVVDAWRENNGAPGVSFSVRVPGETPINIVSGVTNLVTNDPVTEEDYFRIASITKPMTSVIILQLVDEGLVELDEPVATYLGDEWLGDYPFGGDITVRQLLNHTNGLIEYAFDPGFYFEAAQRQDVAFTPEEILDFLGRQEPLWAPGEQYQYETGGFVAAGLIIEAVTGNSAAAEMRARVFEPAGAEHIYLTPEEFPPDPVVAGYVRAELYGALLLLPGVDDVEGLTINDEPTLNILNGEQAVLQSAGWTGGGNEARAESVAAIWQAMFDGTLLSEQAMEEMATKTLDTNYGLGLDVGTSTVDGFGEVDVWSHGGGVPGFRSQAGWVPEHEIAYSFHASLIPLPDGGGVGELRDAMLEVLLPAVGA